MSVLSLNVIRFGSWRGGPFKRSLLEWGPSTALHWAVISRHTYDADGNILQVDGGSTATNVGGSSTQQEFLFDPAGRRVSTWSEPTNAGAAIGTAALYGGAFFGIPAVSAGLEYGAQAIGAYQATALGTTGIVLGAFNENPNYVEEAAARGMNAFNIPDPVYAILNATGNGWTANQAFLNAGISSGQKFYLGGWPRSEIHHQCGCPMSRF